MTEPRSAHRLRKTVALPNFAAELFHDDRDSNLNPAGTIVLSTSCRLLFIDRAAMNFLGTLDPDWCAPTRAQPVPACLMRIVQDLISAQSAMDSGPQPSWARACHLLGACLQPIRAQTFLLPSLQDESRIVLVLSPHDHGVRT